MNYLRERKDTDFSSFSKSEMINNYKQYYGINV